MASTPFRQHRPLAASTARWALAGVLVVGAASAALAAPAGAAPAGATSTVAATSAYNDCRVIFHGLDLQTVTIPQLQAAMAAGTFTSRELTQAYLDRIAAYNTGPIKINAIRAITDDALTQAAAADTARAQGATGPLLGIPILLKDNIDTTDADTTAGSIALAGNRPPADAPIVTQLRAAGAVILAKTNLSEFANWMSEGMPNGFSSLGGQVVNPYDQGDPSGSSSGSAAGGTLAFAAATFGTETSGSILSPSTANSMVGIKPTVGLVSRNGIIPLAHSYDTAGPIARDVTDAAVLLSAVTAKDPSDAINTPAAGAPPAAHNYLPFLKSGSLSGARLGYSTSDEPSDAAGLAVWTAAMNALRKAGATLVETDTLANLGTLSLTETAGIPSEFKYGIADYLAHEAGPVGGAHGRPKLLTDDLTGIIAYNQEHAAQIPYGQSLLIASDATAGATQDDPTSAATILAQRQVIDNTLTAGNLQAYIAPDAAYAGNGAAAGYPSVTVPDGYTPATTGSTPHGIQFLGTAYSEPTLIGLAYSFEQATHDRVPATVSDPAVSNVACAAATPAAAPTSAATAAATAVKASLPASGRRVVRPKAKRVIKRAGSSRATAVAQPSRSLAYTGLSRDLAALGLLAILTAVTLNRSRRRPATPLPAHH